MQYSFGLVVGRMGGDHIAGTDLLRGLPKKLSNAAALATVPRSSSPPRRHAGRPPPDPSKRSPLAAPPGRRPPTSGPARQQISRQRPTLARARRWLKWATTSCPAPAGLKATQCAKYGRAIRPARYRHEHGNILPAVRGPGGVELFCERVGHGRLYRLRFLGVFVLREPGSPAVTTWLPLTLDASGKS